MCRRASLRVGVWAHQFATWDRHGMSEAATAGDTNVNVYYLRFTTSGVRSHQSK